jgi:hypothetical protein
MGDEFAQSPSRAERDVGIEGAGLGEAEQQKALSIEGIDVVAVAEGFSRNTSPVALVSSEFSLMSCTRRQFVIALGPGRCGADRPGRFSAISYPSFLDRTDRRRL